MHDRSPSAPRPDRLLKALCTAFGFHLSRVDRSKQCRTRHRDTSSHSANPVLWLCRFLPTRSAEDGALFPLYGYTKAATQENGCDGASTDQWLRRPIATFP